MKFRTALIVVTVLLTVAVIARLSGRPLLPNSVRGNPQHEGTTGDHNHGQKTSQSPTKLAIPQALKAEHEELHAELSAATRVGGETGKAALAVADALHLHFEAEERFALPPLGLLKSLADGEADADSRASALQMSNTLKREYPKMLAEHREIKKALENLIAAAKRESRPAQVEFAHRLMMHAQTEEEILYPATLLVGRVLGGKALTTDD